MCGSPTTSTASTYLYKVSATYSNTLVSGILKRQFLMEQKMFRPCTAEATDPLNDPDRLLKLAAATMMTKHRYIAPGYLIPRFVQRNERVEDLWRTRDTILMEGESCSATYRLSPELYRGDLPVARHTETALHGRKVADKPNRLPTSRSSQARDPRSQLRERLE